MCSFCVKIKSFCAQTWTGAVFVSNFHFNFNLKIILFNFELLDKTTTKFRCLIKEEGHMSDGLSRLNAKRYWSISKTDKPDFYRTKVFNLKHSHYSKKLTSLCLNSKSQVYQKWKWISVVFSPPEKSWEVKRGNNQQY